MLRRQGPFLRRVGGVLVAAVAAILTIVSVRAADPQPYTVTIATTGNSALDAALKGSSELETLRDKAPAGPFALVMRARQDSTRLETALHSYGYYDGKVHITVDGRDSGDPTLPDRLGAVPKGKSVAVKITIAKGKLFHLGRITVTGQLPSAIRDKLELTSGTPAVAATVLAASSRLVNALEESGYGLAKVAAPTATIDEQAKTIDVDFKVETGPRVKIGPIRFKGLRDVNEAYLRRRLLIHPGELYRRSAVERARLDLLSLGVFSGVIARKADRVGADGRLPITFEVTERPKHAVGATAAYSSDLGGSVTLTWSDRNLFGNAERLNLSASGTGLGGTAVNGVGYNFTAQFVKPDFLRRDQSFEVNLAALKQYLVAYDQQGYTAGIVLHRKLTPLWNASVGVSGQWEQILQEGVTRKYTLIGLPLTLKYDSTGLTNPLSDPTHGIRAAVTAVPTEALGSNNSSFLTLQTTASTYYDLHRLGIGRPGRSVIALRGLVGTIQGAQTFSLPPDQRFYGGGSPTVRGYRYQSIGPQFADGNPVGGTAIDAGTIEFRQRLFGPYGMAAFVDAGQVSSGSAPFVGPVRVGAGIGARYYTSIGPVRLDVAFPVNRQHGDDLLEVYIGLGQAF